MQFLSALFGGSESTLLNAGFALGIVLVLVLLALWAVKFVLGVSNAVPVNRGRRLAVVETVQVDARHKVSIIRRDDVEYVVMTGGNQDVLLEAGIPVDRATLRRPVVRPASVPRHVPQPRPAAAAATPAQPAAPGPASPATPARAATAEPSASFSTRRPGAARTVSVLRSTVLRRSHVIPIQSHNEADSPDDSATSEPDTPTDGQAKLGASTTSRFPGSTFNFEGR